jgi:hypothetical protein
LLHVVRQPSALHLRLAPQSIAVAVHWSRVLPSQAVAGVNWTPSHLAVPSQAARSPRGAPVTAEHFPLLPFSAQASHCPSQASLQQTPSVQNPLAHSEVAAQDAPASFCISHCLASSQNDPSAQSASFAHVAVHAESLQMKVSHETVLFAHLPDPLQSLPWT